MGGLPRGTAPAVTYLRNVRVTGCTFKGSALWTAQSGNPTRFEVAKDSRVEDCVIYKDSAVSTISIPGGADNVTQGGNAVRTRFGADTPSAVQQDRLPP